MAKAKMKKNRYPAWLREKEKLVLISKRLGVSEIDALDRMIKRMYKEACK